MSSLPYSPPTGRSPRRWLDLLPGLLLGLVLCMMLSWQASAQAAPTSANDIDIDTALSTARKQIDTIRKSLSESADSANLLQQRTQALDIQSQAEATADALTPQLASLAARLVELGTAPDGAKEAQDVISQRAQLETHRNVLDSQIKLARLLAVDATQTAEQISALRRTQFQAKLGERWNSFLSTSFWSEFRGDLPRDLQGLNTLVQELRLAILTTPGWAWLAIAALILLILALRISIGRKLLSLTTTRVPPGRLRRSVLALALLILSTTVPGLIAALLRIGTNWNAELSNDTDAVLQSLTATICFGGYVAGLGYALLSPDRSSWRLPPIPDPIAQGMRRLPGLLGCFVVLLWLAERLPILLNSSLATTITLSALAALLLAVALAYILIHGEKLRRAAQLLPESQRPPPRPLWLICVSVTVWTLLITSIASLLVGYVAFGSFIIKQILWTLVVLSSTYLASLLIEDSFSTLLGSAHHDGETKQATLRDQAAVLLSGLVRLMVMLFALVLLLAPFGEAPTDLVHRFDLLHNGMAIGEVQIRPGAVFQAMLVLALCLLVVRILKRWLLKQYLPTTELDPGMQLSAATLFGYTGIVIAIALAMSSAGIGLERVAWIASALTVGIGFGLQAIVQNFVSGLILLAERPVKVGDWVALGGLEGDILRINVRATEIQMGDRSTVIVPNSEFITKTVRNVTHANPLGRVQIKLPMPLDTNAEQVQKLILDAFHKHEDVLDNPPPGVYLDGIEGAHLMFNAQGYVSTPRAAYGVRSTLLFTILKNLAEQGLAMSSPSTMLISTLPNQAAAVPNPDPA